MYRVVKRDGRIVDFEISKIANAMKKAFDATETNYNQSVIDFLAVMVTISSRRSPTSSSTSRISRTALRASSPAAATRTLPRRTSSTASSTRISAL